MSDLLAEAIAEIDALLAPPRLTRDSHYQLLAVVAKLRHASQDRDPRGSSSSQAEEAPVHAPLPSPGVTQAIDTLSQVEGELRGAADLIFRTGSVAIIENAGGVVDLLTINADRVETVLDALIDAET